MNRNAMINDVTNLAPKVQRHYKVSRVLGGGGDQNFDGFLLGVDEQSNNNGEYRLMTLDDAGVKETAAPAATVANTSIPAASSTTIIYITGYGKELGNDGTNLVQVWATVTGNSLVPQ